MDEQQNHNPTVSRRYIWVADDRDAAVLWCEDTGSGKEPEYSIAGRMVYGPLRREGFQWRRIVPPTSVVAAVISTSEPVRIPAGTLPDGSYWDEGGTDEGPQVRQVPLPPLPSRLFVGLVWDSNMRKLEELIDTSPQRDDEPRDDFIRRIARAYQLFVLLNGKPTAELAKRTGRSKGSVSNWIQEARSKGYLPETQKGVVSA